jgi:hypothetical protein
MDERGKKTSLQKRKMEVEKEELETGRKEEEMERKEEEKKARKEGRKKRKLSSRGNSRDSTPVKRSKLSSRGSPRSPGETSTFYIIFIFLMRCELQGPTVFEQLFQKSKISRITVILQWFQSVKK